MYSFNFSNTIAVNDATLLNMKLMKRKFFFFIIKKQQKIKPTDFMQGLFLLVF